MRFIILLVCAALTVSCTSTYVSKEASVISPDPSFKHVEWTEEELTQNIAIRHFYRNDHTSTHLIRLSGREEPHYHDHHDLTVTLLTGQSTIHFENHSVDLSPGDVVFVPRGSFHWAENTGEEASVVFAVFSPGFDGNDKRVASNGSR